MEKIIVLGNGGHARSVCDILLQMGMYEIVGLLAKDRSQIMGIPVLGEDEKLEELYVQGIRKAFVAIGDNQIRRKLTEKLNQIGFELGSAISPKAVISNFADIGTGAAVMPGAVINAYAVIGDGSIINTNASIDHDVKIGKFCHIAPGSSICGTTVIGDGSFIGVGSSLIDGITIGENVMIGAGAAVITDIQKNCLAAGVPAKVIKVYDRGDKSEKN